MDRLIELHNQDGSITVTARQAWRAIRATHSFQEAREVCRLLRRHQCLWTTWRLSHTYVDWLCLV
jgi:hypothetical protein